MSSMITQERAMKVDEVNNLMGRDILRYER